MSPRGALEAVVAHVRGKRLVADGDRVLLALGGGVSSAGLLAAFIMGREQSMPRCELGVVSVEADLREEADAAEVVAEVGRVARAFELPFFAVRPEVRRGGVNLRAELVGLARAQGFSKIALGETRDDEVRAMLRGISEGRGLEGIAGLPARAAGGIVRPLLVIREAEAASLARDLGIEPVLTGPAEVRREGIEAAVLPRWRALAPGLDRSLARIAREVRALRRMVRAEARGRVEAARAGEGRLLFPVQPGAEPRAVVAAEMARRLLREFAPEAGAAAHRRLARMLRYPNGRLCRTEDEPTLVLSGLHASVVRVDGAFMVRVQSVSRAAARNRRG